MKFNIGDMICYRRSRGKTSPEFDDFGIIIEKKTFDGERNIGIYWRKHVYGDNMIFYTQSNLRDRIQNNCGKDDEWILISNQCANEQKTK